MPKSQVHIWNGEVTSERKVETPASLKAKARKREWHFRGIPGEWLGKASALNGKALHTSLAIWLAVSLDKRLTVELRPRYLKRFSVNRHAAYRSLRALERAGLISAERKRGRSAIVTVLGVGEIEEKAIAGANILPKPTGPRR